MVSGNADARVLRIDEFVLRLPDDELRFRLHPHLTVLAGVGSDDRAELLSAVLGSLTGEADDTQVTGTDHTGRPIELRAHRGRLSATFTDDGTPAPSPIGWFAPDADTLRALAVITADDLGLSTPTDDRPDDPPELAEARAELRRLDALLQAARDSRRQRDAAVARLTHLEEQLRDAAASAERRAYRRARRALDQVRAEAATREADPRTVESDRAVLKGAEDFERLARRWAEAADAAVAVRAATGDALDPAELPWLTEVPTDLPDDFDGLLRDAADAENRLRSLEARFRASATSSLPEPEDPRVLALATADQAALWDAMEKLQAARQTFDAEQIRIGGLGPQVSQAREIAALEEAHGRWEEANEVVEERKVTVVASAALLALVAMMMAGSNPLLALFMLAATCGGVVALLGKPWSLRSEAAREEAAALAPLGAPTYLAFQLRRLDAAFDPAGHDRLDLAQADLQLAQRQWTSVAGAVDVDVAAELRDEVRAYAEAIRQHGGVDALARLRRQIDNEAGPAHEEARQRVLAAVRAYGVTGADVDGVAPEVVAAMVVARIEMGHRARLQLSGADAVAVEAEAARHLERALAWLGHVEGELAARVETARWAIEEARARDAARRSARPRAQVEAEIERLEKEVRRFELAGVELLPPGADDVDVDALTQEKANLERSLADDRSDHDIERLTERHAAQLRRVATLTGERTDDEDDSGETDVRAIHHALMARLTRAAKAGPMAEPLPVLLDDPVSRVPADRKWEVMDMLRRLGERTQLLYLTDDPFIGAWARRRAQIDQTITLLEPVE